MKSLLHSFGYIAFLLIAPLTATAQPDPNFHIYLMVGQSNMEGAAPIQAQDRTTNPRVMVLQDENCPQQTATKYGQWRVAAPPLIRCSGLGPGDNFGKIMAENSAQEVTIGLVGAAHGGQKIEYFLKNCGVYNACTPTFGTTPNGLRGGYAWLIDLARKAQQRGVIKGIIFHQGESNTGDPAWPGRVNQLVTDLRKDLGIGNVPFIAGELPYPACCASHNTLNRQLPSVISNAHVVTAEGLNIFDQYHWDSAGVREMGRRYANKMLEHVDTRSNSSSSNGGSNRILVRMSGIVGDESVSLQVGGSTIQTWTVSTYMSDYSASTNASGEIRVAFTNDSGNRDVQVDYIIVNGVVREAEDQDDNTGAWGNSACGGGSFSEWLHCNGSIGFGSVSGNDSSSSSSSSSRSSSSRISSASSFSRSSSSSSTGGSGGITSTVVVNNDWGNGYCANLLLKNSSSAAVTWNISIPVDGTVSSLWNGSWSQSGSVLNVSGVSWNNTLQPGQTDSSVGFCASR